MRGFWHERAGSFRAIIGPAMKSRAQLAILVLFGTASDLIAAHVQAQTELVHVTYRAPDTCPSQEVFLERVRSRTRGSRLATSAELARSFDVMVSQVEGKGELLGRLEFVDVDGNRVLRSLRGSGCDQLVSTLALITALAIDDRIAEAPPDDSSPAPSPASSEPSAPTTKKTNAELVAPPRLPEPASVAEAKPIRLRWEFGGNVGGLTWITNNVSPLFGIYAELGSVIPSWSVRLSGFDSRRGQGDGAERVDSATDWLRLEGCPVALAISAQFSLSPCLAFDAGQLRAQAPNAAGSTGAQGIFWASLDAIARTSWVYRKRLSLSLDAELGVPLTHHEFRLVNSDNSSDIVLQVPKIGAGLKFGLAVRFP